VTTRRALEEPSLLVASARPSPSWSGSGIAPMEATMGMRTAKAHICSMEGSNADHERGQNGRAEVTTSHGTRL